MRFAGSLTIVPSLLLLTASASSRAIISPEIDPQALLLAPSHAVASNMPSFSTNENSDRVFSSLKRGIVETQNCGQPGDFFDVVSLTTDPEQIS